MDSPEQELHKETVRGSSFHTLASTVAMQILGFVTSVLFSRALGPVGRGQYYVPVTVVTVAFYFCNLGTERAQFRLWSRRADKREFPSAAAWMALLLGPLALALALLSFLVAPSLFEGIGFQLLIIAAVTLPFQMHALLGSGLLVLSDRVRIVNLAYLIGAIVQASATISLYLFGLLNVQLVLVLYALSIGVPWLLMLRPLRNVGPLISHRPPIELIRRLIRDGVQVQPYVLFMYLNLRIDILFVSVFEDLKEVGLYSLAVALAELVWLATNAIALAISHRQASDTEEQAIALTYRACRVSLLLAIVLSSCLAALAPAAISLVYGPDFVAATGPLLALLPATAAMAVWRPLANLLVRIEKPRTVSLIATVAVGVNVIANLVFIPTIGLIGAAFASVLSYFVGAGLCAARLASRWSQDPRLLIPGREEVALLRTFLVENGRSALRRPLGGSRSE